MNINQKLYSHTFLSVNPDYVRLGSVLFVGLGFCILSFGAGIVLGVFDKRAEIITKRKTGDGTHTHTHTHTHTPVHIKLKNHCTKCSFVCRRKDKFERREGLPAAAVDDIHCVRDVLRDRVSIHCTSGDIPNGKIWIRRQGS